MQSWGRRTGVIGPDLFTGEANCWSFGPKAHKFAQRRAQPWIRHRPRQRISGQRPNRSPHWRPRARRIVGPLGRKGISRESPVFQGFALRWGTGWAFGPNTFQWIVLTHIFRPAERLHGHLWSFPAQPVLGPCFSTGFGMTVIDHPPRPDRLRRSGRGGNGRFWSCCPC